MLFCPGVCTKSAPSKVSATVIRYEIKYDKCKKAVPDVVILLEIMYRTLKVAATFFFLWALLLSVSKLTCMCCYHFQV